MTDDRSELLDVIDELTQPIRSDIWRGMQKHVRTDPPLLEQLASAVVGNLGSGSGSSRAARERTPMDVGAFDLLEEIDGRVRSWLKDGGEPYAGDLPVLLRSWYVTFSRYPREEVESRRYFGIVVGWSKRIRDIVDPPTRQEITSPCPECGQLWVTRGQGAGTESVRALWALWRSNPEESEALCNGCGKSWQGVSQMRRLRISIDESDTPLTTSGLTNS